MRRRTCDLLGLSTLDAPGLSGYSNGPFLAMGRWTPQRWPIMSLDGQALVIAFFAVALKLLLWFMEGEVGSRPEGAEDIVPTALRPRLDR
jgi:hypothetical protein